MLNVWNMFLLVTFVRLRTCRKRRRGRACFGSCGPILAALMILAPTAVQADDTSEADGCAGCHYNPHQVQIVEERKASGHGNSYSERVDNAYCGDCHAPFQAGFFPDGDKAERREITLGFETWEHVTCGACHPDHGTRVENGTPLGVFAGYDEAGEKTWLGVFPEDANDLCTSCHTGSRHTPDFQAFGTVMCEHKGVCCMDCHMPKVLMEVTNDAGEVETRMVHTHSWDPVASLPYSCGTIEGGCHSVHKDE